MSDTVTNALPKEFSPEPAGRPLTRGESLVGIKFNPSNNLRVDRAKQICAELADIVYDEISRQGEWELHKTLMQHTIGEILNAQMNVVKLITLQP